MCGAAVTGAYPRPRLPRSDAGRGGTGALAIIHQSAFGGPGWVRAKAFFMPSDTSASGTPPATYRDLLRIREFVGLYASFTLTVAASTLSGFALGTLVNQQAKSPFLTAVSMYGATFATVLGALTLMSVADGSRPRRTLV